MKKTSEELAPALRVSKRSWRGSLRWKLPGRTWKLLLTVACRHHSFLFFPYLSKILTPIQPTPHPIHPLPTILPRSPSFLFLFHFFFLLLFTTFIIDTFHELTDPSSYLSSFSFPSRRLKFPSNFFYFLPFSLFASTCFISTISFFFFSIRVIWMNRIKRKETTGSKRNRGAQISLNGESRWLRYYGAIGPWTFVTASNSTETRWNFIQKATHDIYRSKWFF